MPSQGAEYGTADDGGRRAADVHAGQAHKTLAQDFLGFQADVLRRGRRVRMGSGHDRHCDTRCHNAHPRFPGSGGGRPSCNPSHSGIGHRRGHRRFHGSGGRRRICGGGAAAAATGLSTVPAAAAEAANALRVEAAATVASEDLKAAEDAAATAGASTAAAAAAETADASTTAAAAAGTAGVSAAAAVAAATTGAEAAAAGAAKLAAAAMVLAAHAACLRRFREQLLRWCELLRLRFALLPALCVAPVALALDG